MSNLISAIAQAFTWYWDVFGFDFTNPHFWLTLFCLECVMVPLGAFTAWKWGIFSKPAIALYGVATVAGITVNLTF